MKTASLLFFLLLALAPLPTAAQAPRAWTLLDITEGKFSATRLGLLEAELEPLAAFLAIHSFREHNAGVWRGEAASLAMARRGLCLALHLCPASPEARRVNGWLAAKTQLDEMPELPLSKSLFADGVARVIDRLRSAPQPTDALREAIGYLALAAVELAPENESLVCEAELFLRKFPHEGAAWKALCHAAQR